jgi:hypothetical protein
MKNYLKLNKIERNQLSKEELSGFITRKPSHLQCQLASCITSCFFCMGFPPARQTSRERLHKIITPADPRTTARRLLLQAVFSKAVAARPWLRFL